jgi:hypothetical protein
MNTVMNKLRFPSITCQKRYESGAPVREVKQFFVNYCEFVIFDRQIYLRFSYSLQIEVPIVRNEVQRLSFGRACLPHRT